MNGPEHYLEAERLLNSNIIRGDIEEGHHDYAADRPSKSDHRDPDCEGLGNLAAAQVHATLALVAATLEAADQQIDQNLQRPLILRPMGADETVGDPAYPGTPWGRALYGELS